MEKGSLSTWSDSQSTTTLHGDIPENIVLFIVAAMRIGNLMQIRVPICILLFYIVEVWIAGMLNDAMFEWSLYVILMLLLFLSSLLLLLLSLWPLHLLFHFDGGEQFSLTSVDFS